MASITGDLGTSGVPDLFRAIADGKRTGRLTLSRNHGEESGQSHIYFRVGEAYHARLMGSGVQLGTRLVSAGLAAKQDVEEALWTQKGEGGARRLGEIFIDQGLIEREKIEAIVREQIQDTIFEILRWENGDFAFEPDVTTDEDVGIEVSVENLLMAGARRFREWHHIALRVPTLDAVPVFSSNSDGAIEVALTPEEWAFVSALDGKLTVGQLANVCGFTELEAARTVFGLVTAGLLDVELPPGVELPEDDPELEAVFDEWERALGEPPRKDKKKPAVLEALAGDSERLEAEQREADRVEAERLEAEQREADRVEAERLAEEERLDAQRVEDERLEAKRLEAERLEAERLEAQRLEAERLEAERLEAERLEAQRLEAERLEAERLEAERLETERLEAERLEAQRVEVERLQAERLEAERIEAERLEAEKLEAKRLEAERLEAERLEAQRLEAERLEAERLEAERLEAQRQEAERLEAERLEAERLEAERPEAEHAASEVAKREQPPKEERKKVKQLDKEPPEVQESVPIQEPSPIKVHDAWGVVTPPAENADLAEPAPVVSEELVGPRAGSVARIFAELASPLDEPDVHRAPPEPTPDKEPDSEEADASVSPNGDESISAKFRARPVDPDVDTSALIREFSAFSSGEDDKPDSIPEPVTGSRQGKQKSEEKSRGLFGRKRR